MMKLIGIVQLGILPSATSLSLLLLIQCSGENEIGRTMMSQQYMVCLSAEASCDLHRSLSEQGLVDRRTFPLYHSYLHSSRL